MSNITKNLIELVNSGKTVFTTADLALFWKISNRSTLLVTIHRAVEKKYLEKVRKGVYKLTGKKVNIFELAGKLKKNSYISFETVLAQSGIIFQWHNEMVSASDRSSDLENKYGKFIYKNLPEQILIDRTGVIKKDNYFIATQERALCDKIYKDGLVYFDDLSVINKELILNTSKIYNKRLINNIKKICA